MVTPPMRVATSLKTLFFNRRSPINSSARLQPVFRSNIKFHIGAFSANMPPPSKAVVYEQQGQPDELTRVINLPPMEIKPNDVCVKMLAAPINPSDINRIQDPSGEFCQEKRILYKLISGLHASISVHIASDYLLDEASNKWGQNLELLDEHVLIYPDRVRNLYFTYLFVLRAMTKAANYLEHAEYSTGNTAEDLRTQSLVRQLLYNPKLQPACPVPFNEAKLWQGQSGPELKQEIQKQFRNISALMDCVGCEKCRLWGKLQVLGLGTTLKILFSIDGQSNVDQHLQL